MKTMLALLVAFSLVAGSPAMVPAATTPVVELAAADDDASPACSGVWLRHPQPHELAPESDPWTVWLLTSPNSPGTPTYTYEVMWVSGTPQQTPIVTITAGARALKTEGNCFGCTQMIVNITGTTAQDCSTRTVLYPFDHSNGQ